MKPLTVKQAIKASFEITAKPPTNAELAAAYKKAHGKKKTKKKK
ncbi:MAG: hypothetical protein QM703_27575 [Gemmatales bacterium]